MSENPNGWLPVYKTAKAHLVVCGPKYALAVAVGGASCAYRSRTTLTRSNLPPNGGASFETRHFTWRSRVPNSAV